MTIRNLICVAFAVAACATSAMAQTDPTAGGAPATGATPAATGTTTSNVSNSTDTSALANAITNGQQVSTDKVNAMRTSGTLGRVGIVNNYGTGNANASNTGSAQGPVGAGVKYRTPQGQSRFTSATSTRSAAGGAGGTTGGAGRTATGLGGANGMTNMFGTNGGLGGTQASRKPARIPLVNAMGAPKVTAASSNLVSAQIQTLPALAQLPQLQVQTEGRVVTLRGSVATQAEKEKVARTVRMRAGVDKVVNEIVVSEQRSPSDQ